MHCALKLSFSPFPFRSKVVPVSLSLSNSISCRLNKCFCDRTSLLQQTQAPGCDWSALDCIGGEQGWSHSSKETRWVRMGHSSSLHSNCNQWGQLIRMRISVKQRQLNIPNTTAKNMSKYKRKHVWPSPKTNAHGPHSCPTTCGFRVEWHLVTPFSARSQLWNTFRERSKNRIYSRRRMQ